MGIMSKMRDSMPVIMISLAALFLIYIIFEWGMGYLSNTGGGRNSPVLATVNGQDITIQEFNKIVERARENQKAQTGQDIDEEQMDDFRSQVWEAYLNQILIDQQIKKFGIFVTDEEIADVITGDDPPDFLKRSFTDSLGNFNRQAYIQALKDPRNKEPLLQAEEAVRQQLLQEKLQTLVSSSVVVPEGDVIQRFKEQNLKAEASFVFFDPALIPDNQIKVEEKDLEKYYEENLDKYRVEAQRKLKYVMFREQPSKSDSDNVYKNMLGLYESAQKDTDFVGLIKLYSTKPYSERAINPGSLPKEAENVLFSAKVNQIVGPLLTYEGYTIFKILRDTTIKDEKVNAAHILISLSKHNNDTNVALGKAKDLLRRIKAGEDFATLAKQFSDDPGSGQLGGELGLFGKGMMVPEFEKAAFSAKPGEIVGPVKTTYGYHIIKVKGKVNKLPVVAELVNPIKTSPTTKEEIYNQAKDFHYLVADGGQSFDKEAELNKYQVAETPEFTDKNDFVPGIGMQRNLVKFAFNNSLNSVSDVIKIPGGYVVAMVSSVINEGVKKFDEVKEQIKPEVIRQKKLDILLDKAIKLRSKLSNNDSLAAIKNFDQNLIVQNSGPFNYGQFIGGGVGRDFVFNFTAFKLKPGEISQPFKGQRGVYIIQLLSKNDFDQKVYDIQKQGLRNQLLQERKQSFFQQWINELKKNADIEDHRDKFFR